MFAHALLKIALNSLRALTTALGFSHAEDVAQRARQDEASEAKLNLVIRTLTKSY